ncbi:hypothetical protein J2X36_004569 [Methylobacterium sp. BE186]|nr:hypothetical protein [Methylobacterium sp. BE186]
MKLRAGGPEGPMPALLGRADQPGRFTALPSPIGHCA